MELGVNKELGAKRQAGTSEKPREPRCHTHETKVAAGNDMLSLGALQHAGRSRGKQRGSGQERCPATALVISSCLGHDCIT
jgi:hypothetical protein